MSRYLNLARSGRNEQTDTAEAPRPRCLLQSLPSGFGWAVVRPRILGGTETMVLAETRAMLAEARERFPELVVFLAEEVRRFYIGGGFQGGAFLAAYRARKLGGGELDGFLEEVVKVGPDDPRPDLAEDTLLWLEVLRAALELDGSRERKGGVYPLLLGLRCAGCRLVWVSKRGEQRRLHLDWNPALEDSGMNAQEFRARWLTPAQVDLMRVLRVTRKQEVLT